jgi:hypothetical protein
MKITSGQAVQNGLKIKMVMSIEVKKTFDAFINFMINLVF